MAHIKSLFSFVPHRAPPPFKCFHPHELCVQTSVVSLTLFCEDIVCIVIESLPCGTLVCPSDSLQLSQARSARLAAAIIFIISLQRSR